MPGVIRQPPRTAAPAFSFDDLERRGQAILRRAEAQARDVLDAARQRAAHEAEAIRQAAHAEGLAAGRAEGRQTVEAEARAEAERTRDEAQRRALSEARQRLQKLERSLLTLFRSVSERQHHLLAASERGLIRLALAVAERVCKTVVARDSATARENVRALLEIVRRRPGLRVRVHPEELAALAEVLPELQGEIDGLAEVELTADASLERGGVAVQHDEGSIDASVETQLARIAAALIDEAAGTEAGP